MCCSSSPPARRGRSGVTRHTPPAANCLLGLGGIDSARAHYTGAFGAQPLGFETALSATRGTTNGRLVDSTQFYTQKVPAIKLAGFPGAGRARRNSALLLRRRQ